MDCKDRQELVIFGSWSSTDLYGYDLLKVGIQPFFSLLCSSPSELEV